MGARCAAATVLELSEPLDVVAAPLAAPVLCDGHEFTVHGIREAEVIAASGVLGGLADPWFAAREFQGPSGAGFAGTPVFDRDADAVVGLLGETGVYPLANLLEPWPWLRDLLGWRLAHDPALRMHWLPRARGSEIEADTGSWYFTGRTEARRELCAWLEAGPPLLVVTGGPGTGKSAVLAHVLVGADDRWAPRVPTGGGPLRARSTSRCTIQPDSRQHQRPHPTPPAGRGDPAGARPARTPSTRPEALYADRAYDSAKDRDQLRAMGIDPKIAQRGTDHGSGLGVIRWVVERTFAWYQGMRRLRIRWERRDDIHEAFLGLATCVICYRHTKTLC